VRQTGRRYALSPEERAAIEAEERLLASLLERIEAERYAPAQPRTRAFTVERISSAALMLWRWP